MLYHVHQTYSLKSFLLLDYGQYLPTIHLLSHLSGSFSTQKPFIIWRRALPFLGHTLLSVASILFQDLDTPFPLEATCSSGGSCSQSPQPVSHANETCVLSWLCLCTDHSLDLYKPLHTCPFLHLASNSSSKPSQMSRLLWGLPEWVLVTPSVDPGAFCSPTCLGNCYNPGTKGKICK